MTGISNKTKEKFKIIESMLKDGKSEGEIVSRLGKDFNVIPRTQYKIIQSYYTGRTTTNRNNNCFEKRDMIIRTNKGKNKTSLGDNKCYFCNDENIMEHHISYTPEKTIKLCYSCHKKLHNIIDNYHKIVLSKDEIIASFNNLLNGIKTKIILWEDFKK